MEKRSKFELGSFSSEAVVISFTHEIETSDEINEFVEFVDNVVEKAKGDNNCKKVFVLDARRLKKYNPIVGIKLTSAIQKKGLISRAREVCSRCICLMGNKTTAYPAKLFAGIFNKLWGSTGNIQILCCSLKADEQEITKVLSEFGLTE